MSQSGPASHTPLRSPNKEAESEAPRWRILVWAGLVMLPAMLAMLVLLRHVAGVPYQDDYHGILLYEVDFHERPPGMSRLLLFMAHQHNEYKLIFLHGVLFLEDLCLHRVSFVVLQVLGDLLILPVMAILWFASTAAAPGRERRLQLFLPVSLLLFGLNWWELADFAMPSLQYLPCLVFGMLALHWLTSPGCSSWRFWVAGLSANLAVLASANALLLAPLGFLFLISRRKTPRALLWCSMMGPALAAFLFRYTPTPHAIPVHRLDLARFLFSFLGSIVTAHGLSGAVGISLTATLLYASAKGFFREEPFFCLLGWWILITALLVTYGRAAYGLSGALAGRYRINSDLLTIVVYQWSVKAWAKSFSGNLPRRPSYILTTLASLLLCLNSDRAGDASLTARHAVMDGALARYLQQPLGPADETTLTSLDASAYVAEKYERAVLYWTIKDGIYRPPTHLP